MKKKKTIKITKSQLSQLVKEEYSLMIEGVSRANQIKKRLSKINESLNSLPVLKENFPSQEMVDSDNQEVLDYLDGMFSEETVYIDQNDNTISVYKDVNGLDPERDGVDPRDAGRSYVELDSETIIELINSGRVRAYLVEPDDSEQMQEGIKYGSGLLSEGFSSSRKTALSSELQRMRDLAKIGK